VSTSTLTTARQVASTDHQPLVVDLDGIHIRTDTPFEPSFRRSVLWLKAFFRAMRPHHWIKYLLVFVPLVTARAVGDLGGWVEATLMFAAFSLTASGIYLVNDLCDLAADRQHPQKRARPFASGVLPLWVGQVAAPLLLLAGGATGAAGGTFLVLAIYVAMSLAYSFFLKSQPLLDVFVLAGLYTVRLIGGGVATDTRSPRGSWHFRVFCF
jgi:4-hydroxybenzoate polyprenyltransferase